MERAGADALTLTPQRHDHDVIDRRDAFGVERELGPRTRRHDQRLAKLEPGIDPAVPVADPCFDGTVERHRTDGEHAPHR